MSPCLMTQNGKSIQIIHDANGLCPLHVRSKAKSRAAAQGVLDLVLWIPTQTAQGAYSYAAVVMYT